MNDGLPKASWKRDRPFRLGDLEVRPDSGEIRGWHGVQRLRPLLMDLLLRLAAEPGAVVRRETLLEQVWPRRMVNDEVLSRAMAELRSTLGDDVKSARYVETLPKIGYRLVAPVAELEPATTPEPAAAAPLPAAERARRRFALGAMVAAAVVAIATAWLLRERPPAGDPLERQLHAAR